MRKISNLEIDVIFRVVFTYFWTGLIAQNEQIRENRVIVGQQVKNGRNKKVKNTFCFHFCIICKSCKNEIKNYFIFYFYVIDLPLILEIDWLLCALVLDVTTGVGLPHGGVQLPSGHKPRMLHSIKKCKIIFTCNHCMLINNKITKKN